LREEKLKGIFLQQEKTAENKRERKDTSKQFHQEFLLLKIHKRKEKETGKNVCKRKEVKTIEK